MKEARKMSEFIVHHMGVGSIGRIGLSVLWIKVEWGSESRGRFIKDRLLSGHGGQSGFLMFS